MYCISTILMRKVCWLCTYSKTWLLGFLLLSQSNTQKICVGVCMWDICGGSHLGLSLIDQKHINILQHKGGLNYYSFLFLFMRQVLPEMHFKHVILTFIIILFWSMHTLHYLYKFVQPDTEHTLKLQIWTWKCFQSFKFIRISEMCGVFTSFC